MTLNEIIKVMEKEDVNSLVKGGGEYDWDVTVSLSNVLLESKKTQRSILFKLNVDSDHILYKQGGKVGETVYESTTDGLTESYTESGNEVRAEQVIS